MDEQGASRLWDRIERRLELGMPPWRERVESLGQLAALSARMEGHRWTDAEVFEALIRSVLSSSTDWSKVERVLPELTDVFEGFDLRRFAELPPDEISDRVYGWFTARKAGSMTLRQDLLRLKVAAQRLDQVREAHGSLAEYIDLLFAKLHRDSKQLAVALGASESGDKVPGLGLPLAAEFLKSLGFDVAKPDRHINRAAGSFGLVEFRRWPDRSGSKAPGATNREMVSVMDAFEEWAEKIGKPVTFLDNAVWLLCASSGLRASNNELAVLAGRVMATAPAQIVGTTETRVDRNANRPKPEGEAAGDYQFQLRQHLARYKAERLGVQQDGVWERNGQSYPHILPRTLRRLNVVEPIRREFWASAERTGLALKLHRDFHHLNSSQGFAFNLFFPFFGIDRSWSTPFLEAFEIPSQRVDMCKFEYVPNREEGTNFDFFIQLESGHRVFIEVKLSEREFGACVDDDAHRRKWRNVYLPRLRPRVTEEALAPEALFRSYQLARNVAYADDDATVVFLLPRANARLWVQAQRYLDEAVLPPTQRNVRLCATEDLVRGLHAETSLPWLPQTCVRMVSEKYVLSEAPHADTSI